MHWFSLLAVAGGGAAGSVMRHLVGVWFKARGWTAFPWATLAINVIGSLLLGFLAELLIERLSPARQHWFLLLGTGFCGGFTTFSAFELDILLLLRAGRGGEAMLYIAASVGVGLLGVWLGFLLARAVLPTA